jgi:hypothetical protein
MGALNNKPAPPPKPVDIIIRALIDIYDEDNKYCEGPI